MCVFCGSSTGNDSLYLEAARQFGGLLGRRGLRLVYGGGRVGLMGAVADGALDAGAEVVGVITRALQGREIAHPGLDELLVVETMHERKAAMADRADAFVMLPGGFGTWDEFMEVVTWAQLGIHVKPCAVLEVGDFFAGFRQLVADATGAGFIRPRYQQLVLMDHDPGSLIDRLAAWSPVDAADDAVVLGRAQR